MCANVYSSVSICFSFASLSPFGGGPILIWFCFILFYLTIVLQMPGCFLGDVKDVGAAGRRCGKDVEGAVGSCKQDIS